MAGRGTTAADLGAWVCFEDESGQGLRPPRARSRGRRGCTPVVRVRGGGWGRISIAALTCYRPGCRSRLIYRLHLWRGRDGEPKSFSWMDYRDLIIDARQRLGAPIVLVWDNLNRHPVPGMRAFVEQNTAWLTVVQLPSYAPDLNPAEGVWSLLKRGALANLAVADLHQLVRVAKRGLKKIQYRSHLVDGCLAETGLTLTPSAITPSDITH
ncbi:putative transposase [Planomonospora parontospora subsp. antibiotica]|uniref:transposase n=1 Tax=Planomonospora parontospora TaxID=58119 RepID=UPI0016717065|nr:transposase [Planomonospora parontospora]GGL58321.1 putative transposase [Planomonospora parontospora subsp. antibiotica]GII20158.1 putative transposase [Planomonospora parontospora subsp. antibiotica]